MFDLSRPDWAELLACVTNRTVNHFFHIIIELKTSSHYFIVNMQSFYTKYVPFY